MFKQVNQKSMKACWLFVAMVGLPLAFSAGQAPAPLHVIQGTPDFKESYSCTVYTNRLILRHLATGREESVPSGRPVHAIPESFQKLLHKHPDFEARSGQPTSARTALFNDAIHVQVFEGGGLLYEPASGKYRFFWHRTRTSIGTNEPIPLPKEIIVYQRIPDLVGDYGVVISEECVLLSDNAGHLSDKINVTRKSYTIDARVRSALERNTHLASRLNGAISEDSPLFGNKLRVQVFDGGVIIHELASGKNRFIWHTSRGWAPGPALDHADVVDKGKLIRPNGSATTLTDASGARFNIPAGAIPATSKPTLEILTKYPPLAPFVAGSPVYRLKAHSIQNSPVPIVLELPAGKAGDRDVVLVYNDDRWLRIPSSGITLPNGQPGQRVQLVGVSFPWIVTVVGVPEKFSFNRGLVQAKSPRSLLLRLEQLRWTDRATYAAELHQVDLKAQAETDEMDSRPTMVSYPQEKPKKSAYPTILFRKAQLCLLKADPDVQATNKEAVDLYLKGLDLLWQARNAYDPKLHSEWTEDDATLDTETKELVESGSYWRINQIIEQYCGRYAPWGVQLILDLARKGDLKPDQFDLRVIPRYGSKISADLLLAEDNYLVPPINWTFVDVVQQNVAKELDLLTGKTHHRLVLRLWSPQVMDWQLNDLISAYRSYQGWSSWLIGLGKLALFAEGGVTLGVIYQAGMPVLEKLFIDDLLSSVKKKNHSWGLVAGMGFKSVKKIGGWVASGEQVATLGHIKDLYTIVFMAWWLDYFEFDLMKNLRDASAGSTGYANYAWGEGDGFSYNFRVPPIMLMANVWGPTIPAADSRSKALRVPVYQQGAQALIVWTQNLDGYDLHSAFEKRKMEMKEGELDRSWKKFRENDWVYWNYDSDPIEQQVKFRLDKKRLETIAAARQVPVDKLMKDLRVEVHMGDEYRPNTPSFYPEGFVDVKLEECLRSEDDTTHWFALRLRGKLVSWRSDESEVPDTLVEDAYKGPIFKGYDYRPHRQYSIVLKGKKDRDPSFVLPVTFDFKAPETERRADATEKIYVDRTTAQEDTKTSGWYVMPAFQEAPPDKDAPPQPPWRLYWEPQRTRASAILEVPVPDNALAEWRKFTGLPGKQLRLTAEVDPQSKPPQYIIRDAKLDILFGKILEIALNIGGPLRENKDMVRITVHDCLLTVVAEGTNLRVLTQLDFTATSAKKSERKKMDFASLAVPEKSK